LFFNKKKFYTLSDIKNQIVFTPLIFVFFLLIVSFLLIYIFLSYQKQSKIEFVKQNNNFIQQDLLRNYITNIKYNASSNFDDIEIELSNSISEVIGFIHSNGVNTYIDIEIIKGYLRKLEHQYNIDFVLFDTINYKAVYGDNIIRELESLINSKMQVNNFTNEILHYIEYIGDDNIMYWLDVDKRAIKLSFFRKLKNVYWMIGSFSKVDDMKALTLKAIMDSIYNKSKSMQGSYFYFYDEENKKLVNYDNNGEIKTVEKNDLKNFIRGDISHTFKKYRYEIFIKKLDDSLEIKEISNEFSKKLIFGYLIVSFVALLLILSANFFGRFINTIFNRYNKRLERRNFLFKKWKERYELAIIASNDGLWDMNLNTKEIFFSKRWLDMLGYKRGEIRNFNQWINIIHEDDKENVLREYSKHIEKKSQHFICEYRIKDKKGNYKWVLVRGKEFNSNRMLMMSMNIDKRVQLSKELREVESLTEFGRIVIFRLNNNDNLSVKFISKSITRYDYEVEEFESEKKSFIDIIYKEDISIFKNNIEKAIKENQNSFTNIFRILDNQKQIKWVYNRTILIKDDYGEVRSLYGYLNDITKIKASEEELKQKVKKEVEKNLEMDRLLVQQNKLASMGEMLGNISHQWRQPLNNISLIIHFLRDSYGILSKDEFIENVKDAKLQLEFMSQTIDDFRNFYKPSKQIMEFDIKESILKSYKIVATAFEQNDMEFKIESESIIIKNYENEFEQVIVNILSNAVDARKIKIKEKEFKAKVNIDIKRVDKKVKITIFNNCGNIDENIIDRIFEPYFTTKFENQGTGIGLYMTKLIVEKNMKGHIEVENVDDGVEFRIII
jgi:PAS domain S-box-containing protein